MRDLSSRLRNKSISYLKLSEYGFKQEEDRYVYKEKISNGEFEANIVFSKEKQYSELIDIENNTEFPLVDIEATVGEFIGNLRQEYEDVINKTIAKCTYKEIFKCSQTKQVINYIKEKYNDELEFLWDKLDDCAIWRNKQNNKWYGILMKISERKIRLDSDKITEVIDLRYQKEEIEDILKKENIYPGYHMNKKSWITIKLHNSVDSDVVFDLIDNSYNLSVIGSKKGQDIDSLSQKVYDYLLTIPKGKVVTYKQVAEYLGNKGLARVVGNILHKNPDGDKYPCYKVLNSKGELAENFVFVGLEIQKERLEKEGIEVINNKVDLSVYQWK